eukprot:3729291-Amphidinium_carterae.1
MFPCAPAVTDGAIFQIMRSKRRDLLRAQNAAGSQVVASEASSTKKRQLKSNHKGDKEPVSGLPAFVEFNKAHDTTPLFYVGRCSAFFRKHAHGSGQNFTKPFPSE